MWVQFAPPAVRWLMYGLFIVCIIAMIAMPKDERRRMLAGMVRRRTRRSTSPTPDAPPAPLGPWTPTDAVRRSDVPLDRSRSLDRLRVVATASRIVLAVSAIAILVLLTWMVIAFVANVPGWR